MGVVAWEHGLGVIQAAPRDVDLIGIVVALKRELRATASAEATGCLGARAELTRSAGQPPKLGGSDAEPGDERRTGRPSADRTMAIRLLERRARHLVTNPAAKTSALQHRGI